MQNKGREAFTVLTVNDRVRLFRRRWSCPSTGSVTPLDALLDSAEAALTVGVREMACRLNQAARNFDKAAQNLARTAQVHLSGELLRQVVESEGRAVLKAQQSGALAIPWPSPGRPLTASSRIGSGPTEPMCKTTTKRLKGVGMRGDGDNAEALTALDALDRSGEWKHYWRLCLKPVA
jgi:hypothetical protein